MSLVTLPESDSFILTYIAVAFVLKLVDLVHLLAVQCTVDIFLIDWEYPKPKRSMNVLKPTKSTVQQVNEEGE